MIKIPFTNVSQFEQVFAAFYTYEASSLLAEGKVDQARKLCRERLAEFPDEFSTVATLGDIEITAKNYSEARIQYLKAMETGVTIDALKARLWNNIAWSSLQIGGDEMLREADDYSARALEISPTSPPVISTRGSVLLALNRLDESIELLELAERRAETKEGKRSASDALQQAYEKRASNSDTSMTTV